MILCPKRKRVLIADDVPELRRLLSRVIRRDGDLQVVGEAGDGQEAVDRASELVPDVVLLDINMPVRSGLDVLPEIRSALPNAAIVVFSGFDGVSLRAQALGLGADAYVEKGTSAPALIQQVRQAIDVRTAAESV